MTQPATTNPTAAFRRGGEEAAAASKGGSNFPKTHYFGIADGESELLRFVTDKDDWLVVDQHASVPTKPAYDGFTGNWPPKMGAICRKDRAFAGIYADCFICDHIVDGKGIKKPGGRTWALACLREEVKGDGSAEMGGPELKGKVVGIRDQVREVAVLDADGKPTGATTQEKSIVVVNMGYKNFFGALDSFAGHYGTITDRDYLVRRSGVDTSTTYSVIPMDPIAMPDGRRYTLQDPEFAARYATKISIEEILMDRSSDEFYGRFFDRRVIASKGGNSSGGGHHAAPAEAAATKPSVEPSADRMAALASRVTDYAKPAPVTDPSAGVEQAAPTGAPAGNGMLAL